MDIRRGHINWLFIGLLALCLASCKVKRPDTVLSNEKMEDVLYDYHIAKAMGEQQSRNENYKRVLYMDYVYKKHGITEAQFDSSMVWLSRNPKELMIIYEEVNARLKKAKDLVDEMIARRDNKPKASLPGDSIDVWYGQRTFQLTGYPLNNLYAFDIPSDENFQDKDTLCWKVDYAFFGDTVALDSVHYPVMAMQVFYEKDTVNTVRQLPHSGTESIRLWADTLGKIKRIYGFVYFPLQKSNVQVLFDKISLMRYHAADSLQDAKSHAPADSISSHRPAPSNQKAMKVRNEIPQEVSN